MIFRKVNYLDIPCIMEVESNRVEGQILQMNLTGLMIEADKVPFRAGQVLTIYIDPNNSELNITEQARSIKIYESFYRKQLTAKEKKENPGKKLAEVHFVRLNEINRQKLIRYLGRKKIGQ